MNKTRRTTDGGDGQRGNERGGMGRTNKKVQQREVSGVVMVWPSLPLLIPASHTKHQAPCQAVSPASDISWQQFQLGWLSYHRQPYVLF